LDFAWRILALKIFSLENNSFWEKMANCLALCGGGWENFGGCREPKLQVYILLRENQLLNKYLVWRISAFGEKI
jgi:hypothetical protein